MVKQQQCMCGTGNIIILGVMVLGCWRRKHWKRYGKNPVEDANGNTVGIIVNGL